MRIYAALVQCYRSVGLLRQSASAAEEALRLQPRVDDPEQVACMNMNVGRALLDQGRAQDALDAIRRAEQMYNVLDWPLGAARALLNQGIISAEKGDFEGARLAFLGCIDRLSDTVGTGAVRGAALNELAKIERLEGDVVGAGPHLKQARKVLPDEAWVSRAFNARELALCLSVTEPPKARREFERAIDLYQQAGSMKEVAATSLELARYLRDQNKTKDALAAFEQGLEAALREDVEP
jgi:tetratricopeptide (TPR) repeat protein